jgi:L,D-peptidoglycan transpeptidase YkuD (ErfK/YbiS/YcfS/YnhG family)
MIRQRKLDRIVVRGDPSDAARGFLVAGRMVAPCALGRSGISAHKREGDGATPAGAFRLIALLYRPDRLSRPATRLPAAALRSDSGWCDDPADRLYNRPVRLPYAGRHEALWREDRLYDALIVLDHNLERPRPGAGSAIFLHIAAPGLEPTAGCVAVTPAVMRRILALAGPGTVIDIA